MADKKVTALTDLGDNIASADLFHVVDDPSGTPINKKITAEDVFNNIPSFLGLPILLFGYLTLKFPERKKLFMHIVVLFGIIIFLGGLDITRSLSTLFDSFWADLSKLMLLTTGFVFSYWNIKSFIFVRKNRNLEN